MLDTPCFKACFSVELMAPDTVFLLSERGSVCLSDRFVYLVASLIDGTRSHDEIVDAVQWTVLEESQQVQGDALDRSALFQAALDVSLKAQAALFKLEREGYVVEHEELLPENVRAFCAQLDVNAQQAAQRLTSTKVAMKPVGSMATEHFDLAACTTALSSLNVQVVGEADLGQADLVIVVTDDYLEPSLEAFNQSALESQVPWLLVKPVGTIVWFGPLFQAEKTACWQCLAHRLRENRPVESFIQRSSSGAVAPVPPQGFLASTVQMALGMVATEVFKWVVGGKHDPLENRLRTYDVLTHQARAHSLVRRPQCSSCGQNFNDLNRKPLPVVLGHRKKAFTSDGGHRLCSPQETLQKYQHLISPLTGVVRELKKLPVHQLNHTYVAKHHFVTVFDDVANLRKNLGGRSSGKGSTDAQARASGFCEAIERYSGVFQGDEIRIKSSYQKLGEQAIHPNACMNFSQQQYKTREEWNAQCQGWFQKVPEPFDEEREIDWTPVWSLTAQDFKYLPTAYCYYGYPQAGAIDCWADSNGCAAGNTIEEAILQGFMELVERDAVALWWYNRLRKPQVDLDSFDAPYFQSLRQYYDDLGRDLWVLDITSDLNIPTFAAISSRRDHSVENIVLGYGTHFDPKIALGRALTEVNQILPSVLTAKADGSIQYPQYTDPLAIKWWNTAKLAEHSYLVPDEQIMPKRYGDYTQVVSDDLWEDVKRCQSIVEKRNMELLILDQTRSDIALRVVKVISPGMQHMWKRWGGERLYNVPLSMEWCKATLMENQLNPFPMWM